MINWTQFFGREISLVKVKQKTKALQKKDQKNELFIKYLFIKIILLIILLKGK